MTSHIYVSSDRILHADERYGKGLEDTMRKTAPGQEFREKFPEASACMGDIEIHPSHSGVHSAGILVCNDEIIDYATINADGIAQLDKPDSEYLNLLKIDALGLRTLGIIEDAGVVTNEHLYGLDWEDQSVLDILNDDKVSGIFQFEGDAVRSVTRSVHVDRFAKIDHLTALARPGPLSSGMAQKYIERAAGRKAVEFDIPHLEPYLKDTYGVFLYQEQIMSVVMNIRSCASTGSKNERDSASGMRVRAASAARSSFKPGAASCLLSRRSRRPATLEKDARLIWGEMVTFGALGSSPSPHASQLRAVVTYWTCYVKRYFPLEFAAAKPAGA